MEIKKGETPYGKPQIEFQDINQVDCRIIATETCLSFVVSEYQNWADFTQEDIKTLLPYLQSFVETGELEPQEPTLQGEDERVEATANASAKRVLDILEAQNNGLATMQEAGVAMAQNIVEQGKRIQALEQLVREWKSLAESQKFLPSVLDDLQERTSQLLNESE